MPDKPKYPYQIIYPILLIIITIFFSYPSLYYPFGTDQGIFAYMARIINQGGTLYKDAWDIKPPGIYLLYALGMRIFGDSMVAIRVFDFVFTILNALLIFYFVKKLFNPHSAFISAFFYSFYYYVNDFWTLAQVENFLNFFILISFLLLYFGLHKSKQPYILLAGMFSGLTIWFKQISLFFPLLSLYLIVYYNLKIKKSQNITRHLILFAIGGLSISFAFLIYLIITGSFSEFLYTVFVWDRHYGALVYKGGLLKFLNAISVPLVYFFNYHLPFVVLAFIGLIVAIIKRKESGHYFILIYSLASLLYLITQGKLFYYHWVVCYVPMSILIGNLFYLLIKNYRKLYPIAVIIVALILIYIYTIQKYTFSFKFLSLYKKGIFTEREYNGKFGAYGKMEPGHFSIQATYELSDYIKSHTNENDKILIFSFSSLPYYLSEREAPTRFFFNVPVIVRWARKDWREGFINDLKETPPEYFIFIEGDAIPWASGIDKDSFLIMEDWSELSKFFSDNYTYETKIEFFTLYKLTN